MKILKRVSGIQVNNWKEKTLSIFLILSAFIFDGFIASYWSVALDTNYGLMVPRTIFLMFIILSFHYEKKFMLISAAFFGFLMDTYFMGFVGIYLLSLLMIVLIISKLKELMRANVMSYTMLTIVMITIIEIFIYGVVRILGITGMTMQNFLVEKMAATLLLNTLIMLFFSFFIEKLILNVIDKN